MDPAGVQRDQATTAPLMFLELCIRCGIFRAGCQQARATTKPSREHMAAVKHLLRCLKGLPDLVVTDKTRNSQRKGQCDANWGNKTNSGKSTSGYLFQLTGDVLLATVSTYLVRTNSAVHCGSRVGLIGLPYASKEAVYILSMPTELGPEGTFKTVPLHGDNIGPPLYMKQGTVRTGTARQPSTPLSDSFFSKCWRRRIMSPHTTPAHNISWPTSPPSIGVQ